MNSYPSHVTTTSSTSSPLMSAGKCPMPMREAEVPRAIGSTDAALTELESRIELLIKRLIPVSRTVDEKPIQPEGRPIANVQMVEALDSQCRRIDRVIQMVNQATDLLEI